MNSSIAWCANLKSGRNLTRAVASFSIWPERKRRERSVSRKSFFFCFGNRSRSFCLLFHHPSDGAWAKMAKWEALNSFTIAQAISLHRISFFFACFSAFPKHLRKHTKHFTRTTETRPAEERKKFPHRILRSTSINFDYLRRVSMNFQSARHEGGSGDARVNLFGAFEHFN